MSPDEAPDSWIVEDDQTAIGNPLRNTTVTSFLKGLSKMKKKVYTNKKAAAMSRLMLNVMFRYLDQEKGRKFSEACVVLKPLQILRTMQWLVYI